MGSPMGWPWLVICLRFHIFGLGKKIDNIRCIVTSPIKGPRGPVYPLPPDSTRLTRLGQILDRLTGVWLAGAPQEASLAPFVKLRSRDHPDLEKTEKTKGTLPRELCRFFRSDRSLDDLGELTKNGISQISEAPDDLRDMVSC